jgi:hypothetical protein
MNTQIENNATENNNARSETATQPALRNPKSRRVRTGKIARLPVDVREQGSQMLYEGRTHDEIAKELTEDGYIGVINRQNIGSWAKGGYQDWLKTHEFMAGINLKTELHEQFPYSCRADALKLNNVNNFMLAARMNQVIEHLDPKQLAQLVAADPDLFFRFIKEEFNRQQQERELEYKIEDRKDAARRRKEYDRQVQLAMMPEDKRAAYIETKKAELAVLKEQLKIEEQKFRAGDHASTLAE